MDGLVLESSRCGVLGLWNWLYLVALDKVSQVCKGDILGGLNPIGRRFESDRIGE